MVQRNGRPVQRFTQRHPVIVLAVGLAVLGWMAYFEIAKITTARHTVPHGWAAGLAGGVGACLVVTALVVTTLRINRRTAGRSLWLVAVSVILATASVIAAFRISYPASTSRAPYVVTTGIDVALMAYVAAFGVICVALLIWAGTRLTRSRRARHTSGVSARHP